MKEIPRYEFRGQMMTAREIAAATGQTRELISSRLFRGIKGEALGIPPISREEAVKRAKKALHGGTACKPRRVP